MFKKNLKINLQKYHTVLFQYVQLNKMIPYYTSTINSLVFQQMHSYSFIDIQSLLKFSINNTLPSLYLVSTCKSLSGYMLGWTIRLVHLFQTPQNVLQSYPNCTSIQLQTHRGEHLSFHFFGFPFPSPLFSNTQQLTTNYTVPLSDLHMTSPQTDKQAFYKSDLCFIFILKKACFKNIKTS